jgi:hypothetical protein
MNQSAKIARPSVSPVSDEGQALRSCIVIVGTIGLWTAEVNELVQKSRPHVKIMKGLTEQEAVQQLGDFDLIMIFCQAKIDAEFQRGAWVIKEALERIKIGSVAVNFVTGNMEHPNLTLLEEKKLVNVMKYNTGPKALRVKIEYLFSRMHVALQKHRKICPEYYIEGVGLAAPANDQRLGGEKGKGALKKNFGDTQLSVAYVDPVTSTVLELVDASGLPKERERITTSEEIYKQFVLISSRQSDLDFVASLSRNVGSNFQIFSNVSEDIHRFIASYPNSIIFWDVDHAGAEEAGNVNSAEKVASMLSRTTRPPQVFAISDQTVNRLPYLHKFGNQVHVHNILRRGNVVAIEMYSRLVEYVAAGRPRGLEVFFKGGARRQEIRLTAASHRAAAIEATKNFLMKQGLAPRLANQVAQQSDELLLNAIYHAPVDATGKHYRKSMDRSIDFSMSPKEEVTLAVMSNDSYIGVSVRDQFGSVKMDGLRSTLYRDYRHENLTMDEDPSGGIGLNKVLESGFSLLLVALAGEATEATLFFPKVKNHKEFKKNFRFLSLMSLK